MGSQERREAQIAPMQASRAAALSYCAGGPRDAAKAITLLTALAHPRPADLAPAAQE